MTDEHDTVTPTLAAETADYAALSRGFAASGDVRKAVLTQWAADLRVLQSLLWENGLGQAPDPAAGLLAVADALQGSWAQHVDHLRGAGSARDLVDRARAALAAAFDPSVHALLASRLTPIDHLEHVADADPGPSGSTYRDWRSPAELLRDLRVAGQDAERVARALADEDGGESDDPRWQAVLAMFEAYLVRSALLGGDDDLLTAELRWELAAARVAAGETPGDSRRLRSALTDVLGPAERAGVLAELADLDQLPEDDAR
jgi:hypothetical protein